MNFVFGWIDTINQNYPCLPPFPDTENCLVWQHVEILTGVLQGLSDEMANILYNQAFRLRLNNFELPNVASIYRYAASKGIYTSDLLTMLEYDSYIYNTTKDGNSTTGQSMVCDVFVCNVWKASGIFNDINNNFDCAELTNWDDYVLTVFDPNYETTRPQQCQQADPGIPICQLAGDYNFFFNNYMLKAPYENMGNWCPGQPPNYTKPLNC